MMERLWEDHLSAECAVINTEEERKLTKRAIELHEKANALLNQAQVDVVEKYVNALLDLESLFVKKAFFKGYEFSVSFLLESGNLGK